MKKGVGVFSNYANPNSRRDGYGIIYVVYFFINII